MVTRSVVVLGAGMAGLVAALALAQDGHRVTLLERDGWSGGEPQDAPSWPRAGIPHFLQPHAFVPRGRAELSRILPDVFAELLAAGAHDVDLRAKLPGAVEPGDELLQYLAVRRPLIEWALRRAVDRSALVTVRPNQTVTGLSWDAGRACGVLTAGGPVAAELVVDALGRRTPRRRWLAEVGITEPDAKSSDCGVVYYSRYYRQRPDFELPDGPWMLGPRGDLGYLGFATFPGDNRTFAALLSVPTGTREWQGLRHDEAFEAAVAQIPALAAWVNPAGVDPITDVRVMAGLHNTLSDASMAIAAAVVPIGDAYSHTDPLLALGLSFALVHASELTTALRDSTDLGDALNGYEAATMPALRERYALATELDDQRLRGWAGESIDFAHQDGAYAMFSVAAAGAAAMLDPQIFRTYVRRVGLLESTSVLDDDLPLRVRIEALFADLASRPRPAPGPSRDAMLKLVAAG